MNVLIVTFSLLFSSGAIYLKIFVEKRETSFTMYIMCSFNTLVKLSIESNGTLTQ